MRGNVNPRVTHIVHHRVAVEGVSRLVHGEDRKGHQPFCGVPAHACNVKAVELGDAGGYTTDAIIKNDPVRGLQDPTCCRLPHTTCVLSLA